MACLFDCLFTCFRRELEMLQQPGRSRQPPCQVYVMIMTPDHHFIIITTIIIIIKPWLLLLLPHRISTISTIIIHIIIHIMPWPLLPPPPMPRINTINITISIIVNIRIMPWRRRLPSTSAHHHIPSHKSWLPLLYIMRPCIIFLMMTPFMFQD